MELIKVENVSRKYSLSLGAKRSSGLKDMCRGFFGFQAKNDQLRKNEFWGLKDISFSLQRGEALGLLGLNGAGKSTLLKILAGRLAPTAGTITLSGTMNAMLELGSGYVNNLSGRENIDLLCSMKGLSSQQVAAVTEEIIDFAELGKFIDSPVSFYSSGMRSRLAFGISIITKPDILLVDEVLSVGDFKFRQKCLNYIDKLRNDCALVLVSHSAATISMFCNTAIVLEHGVLSFSGTAKEATNFYLAIKEKTVVTTRPTHVQEDLRGEVFENPDAIHNVRYTWHNAQGQVTNKFCHNESIFLQITFELPKVPTNLILGIPVWNEKNVLLTGFSSDNQETSFPLEPNVPIKVTLEIKPCLNPGKYKSVLAISDGPGYLYRQYLQDLHITGAYARMFGDVLIPHKWKVELSSHCLPEQKEQKKHA